MMGRLLFRDALLSDLSHIAPKNPRVDQKKEKKVCSQANANQKKTAAEALSRRGGS